MPELFGQILASSPSHVPGSYIYSVLLLEGDRLVALTSADELVVLDKNALRPVSSNQYDLPKPISCMTSCKNAKDIVICGGGDGGVAISDTRIQRPLSHFNIGRGVTALEHQEHEIAVGSELAHSQAVISIWDERKQQMRWQSSENNDDITALQYHPLKSSLLLSGGDDGLVGVWDTNIDDENDSLVQAFDHGPIHKAGFLSATALYALSSDQKLSIHPFNSPEHDALGPFQPALFGDIRPTAECDYVIDILRDVDQCYVVTGSNLSNTHIDIIPLAGTPPFSLSGQNVIRLMGAHGEEIVRSIVMDKGAQTVYTGGEDGCVKAFRKLQDSTGSPSDSKTLTTSVKKSRGGRFQPY